MAHVTGLTSDQGYRWRFVSTNADGTTTLVSTGSFHTLVTGQTSGGGVSLSFGEAIDAVIDEGGFDSARSNQSRSTVGRWINSAHKEMVRKSRLLGERRLIASTISGQAAYALDPDVLEIQTVVVGGVAYARRGRRELRLLQSFSDRRLAPGLWFPTYSGDQVFQIELDPAPLSDGADIVADIFVAARTMTDELNDFLVVPYAFCEDVIDRAIAYGDNRVGKNPFLASQAIESFEAKCEELRRNANQRSGGSPTQLRVVG